jgi:hypothetical protein
LNYVIGNALHEGDITNDDYDDDDDDNNNNNLWLYVNVFNRPKQQTCLLLQLSSSVTYPEHHRNF